MLQRWLVVIIGLPLLLAALLLCPDWVTVIVVCGIAAAAAYELLHTAGKKVPKCVYAFTILAAVAQEWCASMTRIPGSFMTAISPWV
ncbi:MAG: hypothetical protein ACLSHO_08520 [Dysosmobacter sp.]